MKVHQMVLLIRIKIKSMMIFQNSLRVEVTFMLANIGEADGGIAPGTNFEDITDD